MEEHKYKVTIEFDSISGKYTAKFEDVTYPHQNIDEDRVVKHARTILDKIATELEDQKSQININTKDRGMN